MTKQAQSGFSRADYYLGGSRFDARSKGNNQTG